MLHIQEIAWIEPCEAASRWREAPFFAFLDSASAAAAPEPRARYSYLAPQPFSVLTVRGGVSFLDGVAVDLDPFALLRRELARFPALQAGPLPFTGGAVGFLGYELGRFLDRQAVRDAEEGGLPEMAIGLYDSVIGFDHAQHRAWIVSSGVAEPARRAARAAECIAELARQLAAAPPHASEATPHLVWHADLDPDTYRRRVRQVQQHIKAGDIFQANFTSRFRAARPRGLKGFDLYRSLRARSPAPFAAWLACGEDYALASASPEQFVRLSAGGEIEARPIKGTRPRGSDIAEDVRLAQELADSAKDRAENLMIADLLRNDVGRVAEVGSVAVPSLMAVESFASVHHLVSAVTARLRPGLGPVDLLGAIFPCGSVTGAPKIRAMEIIAEQEVSRRGPYCGALGWIGFDGAMEMSVVIRTLILTPDAIFAHAGGGIVADSDPLAEYAEMRLKLRPLLGQDFTLISATERHPETKR